MIKLLLFIAFSVFLGQPTNHNQAVVHTFSQEWVNPAQEELVAVVEAVAYPEVYNAVAEQPVDLLAKLIQHEAGSEFVPEVISWGVGEVALNRVASAYFPDTLEEVIYQQGQYESCEMIPYAIPSQRSVDIASRLLAGERMLNDVEIIYQSNFEGLGNVIKSVYVEGLGYTYFAGR